MSFVWDKSDVICDLLLVVKFFLLFVLLIIEVWGLVILCFNEFLNIMLNMFIELVYYFFFMSFFCWKVILRFLKFIVGVIMVIELNLFFLDIFMIIFDCEEGFCLLELFL